MSRMSKVGNHATTVTTHGGVTTVTYHNTKVVQFTAIEVTLNSGGWLTATTKARMNQASNQYDLGYTVYQKDHKWYVQTRGWNEPLPFRDGMSFMHFRAI